MSKFNPAMLVPATQVAEFSKTTGQRTPEQVALANVAKMKEQFAAGDAAEGKKNFKLAGDRVAFTLRVNNTALVLGTYEEGGKTADVREMTVPKANFMDALDYYADRIKAGEFTAQLSALAQKREARSTKASATRAAKRGAIKGEMKSEAKAS